MISHQRFGCLNHEIKPPKRAHRESSSVKRGMLRLTLTLVLMEYGWRFLRDSREEAGVETDTQKIQEVAI